MNTKPKSTRSINAQREATTRLDIVTRLSNFGMLSSDIKKVAPKFFDFLDAAEDDVRYGIRLTILTNVLNNLNHYAQFSEAQDKVSKLEFVLKELEDQASLVLDNYESNIAREPDISGGKK